MTTSSIQIIAEDAVAVAVGDAEQAQTLAAALRMSGDWIETVPGMDSVTIRFDPSRISQQSASQRLLSVKKTSRAPAKAAPNALEIAVRYGGASGPDLAEICTQLGLTEADFIARHTAQTYPVEMIGFTPGFAYLGGLDAGLSVPRRARPRTHVPAGSIGISGTYSGLYAMPGPGGWPLIGRTDQALFDAASEPPFLIQPGQLIHFTAA